MILDSHLQFLHKVQICLFERHKCAFYSRELNVLKYDLRTPRIAPVYLHPLYLNLYCTYIYAQHKCVNVFALKNREELKAAKSKVSPSRSRLRSF